MHHESLNVRYKKIASNLPTQGGRRCIAFVSLTVLWVIATPLDLNVPFGALAQEGPIYSSDILEYPNLANTSPRASREGDRYEFLRNSTRREQAYNESRRVQQWVTNEKDRARSTQPTSLERATTATGEYLPGAVAGATIDRVKEEAGLPPPRGGGALGTALRWADRLSCPLGPNLPATVACEAAVEAVTPETANPSPSPTNDYPNARGEALRELQHEQEHRSRMLDQAAREQGYRDFADMGSMIGPDGRIREDVIGGRSDVPTLGPNSDMQRYWTVDQAREWALNRGYTDVPVLYEDQGTGEVGLIEIRATEFLQDGGRCREFRNVWLPGGSAAGNDQPISYDDRTACTYGTFQNQWSIDGAVLEDRPSSGQARQSIDDELARLVGEADRGSRLGTDVSRSQYDRGVFDTALGAVDQRTGQMQHDNRQRVQEGLRQMADAAMSAMRVAQQRAELRARSRQVAQSQRTQSQPVSTQTAGGSTRESSAVARQRQCRVETIVRSRPGCEPGGRATDAEYCSVGIPVGTRLVCQ